MLEKKVDLREIQKLAFQTFDAARKFYSRPENLIPFAQDILGYKDLTQSLHGEVVKFVNNNKSVLVLLPRGHLKSTLLTISRTIQEMIINPDIRIYITNAVLDLSQSFLREIKSHCENNEMLLNLAPDIFYKNPQRDSPKWTESEITVKRKKNSKESTVTVGAVGAQETGSHFDLHIYDDIVNLDNVNTPELIRKTLDWYRMSLSLLEPTGRKWIIGTRYDFSDLYATLIESGMPHIVKKAIENGRPILPNRFSFESLGEIKRESGSFFWSTQYENDPIDPETAVFKRQYLQYYDHLPTGLNCYILVDLAISQKDQACETAIEVVGYDKNGNLYIIDDCAGKLTPLEIIHILYKLHAKYGKPTIGIERQQLEKALSFWLQEAGKKYGYQLPYYKLKPDSDKERRITSNLQPLWEDHRIWLRRNMPELEMQFMRFPKYSKRDRIDALAYISQILVRPTIQLGERSEFTHDYGSIFEKWGDTVKRIQRRKIPEKVSLMNF